MSRFIVALVVILALVVGLAAYFRWLDFSVERSPDRAHTQVSMTIDNEKIKEDVEAAKEKAKQVQEDVAGRVPQLAGTRTVQGTLQGVEVAASRLTVAAEKETVEVAVNADTKVQVGQKDASLTDLRAGQKATVTYSTKDNKHTAKSIAVDKQ